MAQEGRSKGTSGWWLAVAGLLTLAFGVGAYLLDSAGVIDISYTALIYAPITIGALLLLMGVGMGVTRRRIESDGRNRYGKRIGR